MTELATMGLGHYEQIIESGLQTFLDVGNALLEIKAGRLFLQSNHTTFEDYCQSRWGFSQGRAYQLMGAAETVGELSTMVEKSELPTSERQVRALTNASSDTTEQAAIMKEAAKKAPKGKSGKPKLTAKGIKAAADKVAPKPPKAAIDPDAARIANITGKPATPAVKPSGFDPVELEAAAKSKVVDTALPIEERIAAQVKMLESFCRLLVKTFDDNLPSDPWLDEGSVEIAKSQLRSCCGAIRAAKAHTEPCPKCHGKGCKIVDPEKPPACRGAGYMPKHEYQMRGGE